MCPLSELLYRGMSDPNNVAETVRNDPAVVLEKGNGEYR